MEALRTPDDRFTNLPDFPYAPRYFLYRKMIPVLVRAGLRAVAPDLVGFGRSDKPVAPEAYTYSGHVAWMKGLVEALDLRGVTLFGRRSAQGPHPRGEGTATRALLGRTLRAGGSRRPRPSRPGCRFRDLPR